MEIEGFGVKSINNLLDSIEESKNNSLERLLFGLGIRHVGSKTAKILAKHFKNIDNLIASSYEELIAINDIGEGIAQSIELYFKYNLEIINQLKVHNINMKYIEKTTENPEFNNKIFVLTGSLSQITRNEAQEKIEELGGNVSSSVSKNTYALITGEQPGSKYNKALQLGINIWNEEEFINKLLN